MKSIGVESSVKVVWDRCGKFGYRAWVLYIVIYDTGISKGVE